MTLPETQPSAHRPTADAWFADRFGVALPRGLRDLAAAMSWRNFVAVYGPTAGPLRIGHWECTDTPRPASRLGPQARNYRAVIAQGDHISASTAAAGGPVAALTAMLHQRGIALETLNFHQMHCDEQTVTFLRGTNGARTEWAMGWSDDPTQSALRAVIACANRLAE
ncbi:homocitrate synthase [Mycobacterium asiaticum]|uniref:Homocitrate synthase n=1 Tax=Mycobacterium asiaticum TaxID=1790 RepID=A0A1A3N5Z5_MYCAS|nr:homocitrate synthase [Mycobacterium asiaticum]OBK15787.1 homocitrate synthase [Mycobacterium asiaticum]